MRPKILDSGRLADSSEWTVRPAVYYLHRGGFQQRHDSNPDLAPPGHQPGGRLRV